MFLKIDLQKKEVGAETKKAKKSYRQSSITLPVWRKGTEEARGEKEYYGTIKALQSVYLSA